MNLIVVQPFAEHLHTRLHIRQIVASVLYLDVREPQIKVRVIAAYPQHDTEKLPLRAVERVLRVLCPSLSSLPAVAHDGGLPGVARGTTAVPVRHTADSKYLVVHIIDKRLCVGLVQLRSDAVDFSFKSWLTLNIDSLTTGRKLAILLILYLAVLKHIIRIDKILHTINAVALDGVYVIQQRHDHFKAPSRAELFSYSIMGMSFSACGSCVMILPPLIS